MMKYLSLLVILMTGLAPNVGLGGLVGEPAPPLNVSEWIKGAPVEVKPGTNIFVLEILNVSRPDGRAVITNLSDIQTRFKTNGVVVVGISDEPREKLTTFVQNYGSNIECALVMDNKRHTALSYMTPVGMRGIPYAFVVGTNGNLLWHGHPLRGLVEVLDEITHGKYDVEQVRKMDLAKHQMQQYVAIASQGSDRAELAGRNLLAARTNDVTLLCDLAFEIATAPKIATRDFALAYEALDQAEKLVPTNTTQVMINRAIVLFESGKRDQGLTLATQSMTFAQSPVEKNYVQSCISSMNARLAAAKSSQSNTNQAGATPGKDSPAKL